MRHDITDKATQTLIFVTPYVLAEEEAPRIRVRSNAAVQTETHLPVDLALIDVETLLRYTPFADIERDALRVTDIPKRNVLTFSDIVHTLSIEDLDELSPLVDADVATPLPYASGKSNLKHPTMEDVVQTADAECQTYLIVRPFILDLDDIAQVYCSLQVQTSATFAPDASLQHVTDDLHKYVAHVEQKNPVGVTVSTSMHGKRVLHAVPEDAGAPGGSSEDKKRKLTAEDIQEICNSCCTDEEVLNKIQEWYKDVCNMVACDEDADEQCRLEQADADALEAGIVCTLDGTVDMVQSQVDRMKHYMKPTMADSEIQNTEFADHLDGRALCMGSKRRNVACMCDCQLLPPMGRGTTSSPAIVCACQQQQQQQHSDRKQRSGPLQARACTTRKCNCLYSEGCLHCERALARMQKGGEQPNMFPAKKTCKKYQPSQNIEFLTELDGDYADAYLELLEQDNATTQTEPGDAEAFFGEPEAPKVLPPPCSCLTNVEMPWDMLLVPPTPKKRPPPVEEAAVIEALPEEVRARLKQLTVTPMNNEELLAILREFLEDNMITDADDISAIEKALLAEKARADAELAAEEAADEEEEEEAADEDDEGPPPVCKPRPALKPFQVFDPETERYNEPYMDRLYKFIGDDDDENALGVCTSHVEMPWHQIELPKAVRIRKGKHPCEVRPAPTYNNPQRKCGAEYRANMKRQRALFGSSGGIVACLPNCGPPQQQQQQQQQETGKTGESRSGVPVASTTSSIRCLCIPVGGARPPLALHKGKSDTCVCAPAASSRIRTACTPLVIKKQSAECPPSAATTSAAAAASKERPCAKSSTSTPKTQAPCGVCPTTPSSGAGRSGAASQSRTERIAALLESCKKEMEPIKDGINQLRSRIRELNLSDLTTPPAPSNAFTSPHELYNMPPPMMYPTPMMMYPFPPCCYPPPTGQSPFAPPTSFPPTRNDAAGGSAGGGGRQGKGTKRPRERSPRLSACGCKSKQPPTPSSVCNTSTTGSASASDVDEPRGGRSRSSRSRSRLLCACKPSASKQSVVCGRSTPSQCVCKNKSKTNQSVSPPKVTGQSCGGAAAMAKGKPPGAQSASAPGLACVCRSRSATPGEKSSSGRRSCSPAPQPPTTATSLLCACTGSKSKKQSRIPRLHKSGTVCPCPSLASAPSHHSRKNHRSRSCTSSGPEDNAGAAAAKPSTRSTSIPCKQCSSIAIVKSCATQFTNKDNATSKIRFSEENAENATKSTCVQSCPGVDVQAEEQPKQPEKMEESVAGEACNECNSQP